MTSPAGPYANFNFLVEIDGITLASFSECSGLGSEVSVIEYREGGDVAVRKIPGLAKVGDITMKRGITASRQLYDWHADVLKGSTVRRNGAVILLDEKKTEVARWNFYNAFPCKWEGPTLDGTGNDVAIETFTLSCEGIERA